MSESNHKFHPESEMMSYGYNSALSEGSIKCPIFQTSTFVFKNAEAGKAYFELAVGLREKAKDEEEPGLIYSRLNNPDLEILEDRLCLWDEAEDCAVFESGMSAISTVFLTLLKPGDVLLYSSPTYGGTDHLIHHFLPGLDITCIGFHAGMSKDELIKLVEATGKPERLKLIFIETPANPTNDILDISCCKAVADHFKTNINEPLLAVDNTYMGPLWQHPLKHGADFVIYSATKYIGGHSDVIAGAVLGSKQLMKQIRHLRTYLGNMAGPWTGWLLMRSLETLKVRMEAQTLNAQKVAAFLVDHPKIEKVYYPGLIRPDSEIYEVYKRQYTAPGAMLSFDIAGGEKEAFKFLNNLKMMKLAVSLGSTESLVQHPYSMTHAGVDPEFKKQLGVTPKMVRLSVGVENYEDIIWDIKQSLDMI
ncbi:cystathionine gamma-synthase family protein [Saccharicrinis sp. FJH2]|uniref:cystathionine gamma-synthase family protein n=1 Tax=Saccharicrinis sp. FJH65 TaxID=3344659 RepID=UPI0035F2DE19